MIYSTTPRSRTLFGLVQSIWCYQAETTHEFELVQPTVNSQLLINLHENELRHWTDTREVLRTTGPVGAQGLLTSPVLIDTQQKRNVCGVEFTSFGLSAFVDSSASGFTDSIVDATEFWGQKTLALRNKLIRKTDPAERCQLIESFLTGQPVHHSGENKLIEDILCLIRTGMTLSAIRDKAGLSQRAFYTLFEKRIGVRPKTYARIERFSATLEPLSDNAALIDIALDKGFSDQAHFTREFRTFTGNTPTHHHPLKNESHHAHVRPDKLFKTPDRLSDTLKT